MNTFIIFIFTFFVFILAYAFFYAFYQFIYAPYKLKTSDMSIENILLILKTVINTEIEMYEKNIFVKRGAMTNANFENYYKDIVTNITKSLSKEFYFKAGLFLTEEAIVTIICRQVKDYLTEKINDLNNIE